MEKTVLGFAILAVVVATISAADVADTCGPEVGNNVCRDGLASKDKLKDGSCTAAFGAFESGNIKNFQVNIQDLVQHHLELSMKYLELANHFNEWNVNRKGFHEYFKKLSDEAWEDAIAIMQHMIKRGGSLQGTFGFVTKEFQAINLDSISELTSLSQALDMEKKLVERSLKLLQSRHEPEAAKVHSDPEFTHFLAEKLSDRHVLKVKHLANHVNALSAALDSTVNTGLALHIYDSQVLK